MATETIGARRWQLWQVIIAIVVSTITGGGAVYTFVAQYANLQYQDSANAKAVDDLDRRQDQLERMIAADDVTIGKIQQHLDDEGAAKIR